MTCLYLCPQNSKNNPRAKTDHHEASGSVKIDGGELGCQIAGKVAASGSIELRGNVRIGGDVKTSGKVSIFQYGRGGVVIGGNISTSGGVTMEGDVVIE